MVEREGVCLEMDARSAGRERDVKSVVDDEARRTARHARENATDKSKQLTRVEIRFPNLDEVHAARHGSLDLID